LWRSALYDAFSRGDRPSFESLITDDFRFTSPYDDAIDRAEFFERCWPNHTRQKQLTVQRIGLDGAGAFVTYDVEFRDGHRAENTEWLAFRDGKVKSVDVYFGASHTRSDADARRDPHEKREPGDNLAKLAPILGTWKITGTNAPRAGRGTSTTPRAPAAETAAEPAGEAADEPADQPASQKADEPAAETAAEPADGHAGGHAGGPALDPASLAVEGEETYEVMRGDFFVMGRWTHRFPDSSEHTGISVIGHEPERGSIMCENFDNLGYAREYRVAIEGNSWTLTGAHERATYTFADDGNAFTVEWETSTDGRAWTALCRLEGRK
jgi:hypothetical protein